MSEIAMSNRDKALKKELSTYMDLHYPERRTDYGVMLAHLQRRMQRKESLISRMIVSAYIRREARKRPRQEWRTCR